MRQKATVDTESILEPSPEGSSASRIAGYDLARAFAYFGMVLVHFRIVGAADQTKPPWLYWMVERVEGRAAATFVTLAGVGLSLISAKARASGDPEALRIVRRRIFRRSMILLVVGLLYYPIWPADILHCYGVYLAFGSIFLTVNTRWLWGMGLGLVVLYVPMFSLLDYAAEWNFATLTYRGFWTPLGFLKNLIFNGFNPVVPWLAFLLFGIWLGRQDLRDHSIRRPILVWSSSIAIGSELTSTILVRTLTNTSSGLDAETVMALFGSEPMPPLPPFMLTAGGTSIAVICLAVALAEKVRTSGWLSPLVATGQMALTLYVAHVIIGLGSLDVLDLTKKSLPIAVGAGAVFCLLSVAFAAIWRTRFQRGPLEWVLRRLAAG